MKFVLALLLLMSTAFAKDITLNSENTVSLFGPVDRGSIGEVMHELNRLSQIGKKEDPIYLILYTPGGSVLAGLELINYMNTLRRPVHSVAIFAASMGFHILENSPVRYITKYATVMSHRANGGFQGDIPQQVTSRLNHVIQLVGKMDEQVVSRTDGKFDKKSYQELIRDEYWVVGDNAIKDGFADEVASLKCDDSLNGTIEKNFAVGPFLARVKLSRCPLITAPIAEKEQEAQEVTRLVNTIRNLEL
jgi:ATP-dependent Clp protease protease subunit